MSQHDLVLATIVKATGLQTQDRSVSGYTGHYLENGLYFYVGLDPKRGGPVRITTNIELPNAQASWMPKGSVRSAFMSDDLTNLKALIAALKDPNTKAPQKKATVKKAAAVQSTSVDELLAAVSDTASPAASPAPLHPLSGLDTAEELPIEE